MKMTVTKSMFHAQFIHMGRKDNFSYDGLAALFDYLEEINEDMELCVIAICCEYTEYEDLREFQDSYGEDYETIADIEDATTVIRIEDGPRFIIRSF